MSSNPSEAHMARGFDQTLDPCPSKTVPVCAGAVFGGYGHGLPQKTRGLPVTIPIGFRGPFWVWFGSRLVVQPVKYCSENKVYYKKRNTWGSRCVTS